MLHVKLRRRPVSLSATLDQVPTQARARRDNAAPFLL